MEHWFTSDLHFGHANIIEYCKRPYADTNEMDEAIYNNLYLTVPAGGTLWVLGDVAMKGKDNAEKVAARLAQMPFKIKIIGGNHDKGRFDIYRKHGLLEHESGRHEYDINGTKVSMGHYPLEGGTPEPKVYLCGHIHEKWRFESFGSADENLKLTLNINCNVGVDVWDMKPVHLDTIIDYRDGFYLQYMSK